MLTYVTAVDGYHSLAEMQSCSDGVRVIRQGPYKTEGSSSKVTSLFMLLLVVLCTAICCLCPLSFTGGEAFLKCPRPAHFVECHPSEISLFLFPASFPFGLLSFAFIQYCVMVHSLSGSEINKSCWHFCWCSKALMMVRTRAMKLGQVGFISCYRYQCMYVNPFLFNIHSPFRLYISSAWFGVSYGSI